VLNEIRGKDLASLLAYSSTALCPCLNTSSPDPAYTMTTSGGQDCLPISLLSDDTYEWLETHTSFGSQLGANIHDAIVSCSAELNSFKCTAYGTLFLNVKGERPIKVGH